ncbi:MAG: hypothetical protein HQK61_05825, partial [Desulfamplus sp.]|nr:hypothetical protein [Desulfamplus sp.]
SILTGQMVFTDGQVQVSVRLVETETGRIVASVNHVFGSLAPVAAMANMLGGELSRKIEENYPVRAKIIDAGTDGITIDTGSDVGVKTGDRFVYYKNGSYEEGIEIDSVFNATSTGSPFRIDQTGKIYDKENKAILSHSLFVGQKLQIVDELK